MIFIVGGAYQGKYQYAAEHFDESFHIINCFHEKVRGWLEDGKNPMEEIEKLDLEDKKLIIISDEMGCGLVPIDAFLRNYREQNGRVNCHLASCAEKVFRVVSGQGIRIK